MRQVPISSEEVQRREGCGPSYDKLRQEASLFPNKRQPCVLDGSAPRRCPLTMLICFTLHTVASLNIESLGSTFCMERSRDVSTILRSFTPQKASGSIFSAATGMHFDQISFHILNVFSTDTRE